MNAKESRSGLRWSAALLALQLASISAQAAVLNLSPLMLSVAPGERAAGLNIGNQAQTPTTLQVRLLSWTQDGTRNLYAPADGWVVSPPMVVVPGNDTQLLRVIRRELANAPVEQAYRVFIDELPPADAPSGGAVRVLMRYSLPLFVEASQPTLPDVAWTLQSCGKDWFLQAQNRGGRHLKLLGYNIRQGEKTLARTDDGLLGYVLAGQGFRWALPDGVSAPAGDAGLTIAFKSATGDQEAPLALVRDAAGCADQS